MLFKVCYRVVLFGIVVFFSFFECVFCYGFECVVIVVIDCSSGCVVCVIGYCVKSCGSGFSNVVGYKCIEYWFKCG